MKYFDLHADTVYRCLGEILQFDDKSLHITANKACTFDEWHQCFAIFIKDGIAEPFKYYKKAADFKNSTAAYNLSIMYRNGLGVTKDDTMANYWKEKSNQYKK